ncbi:hypothetical protein EV652_1049 [Kribbella steppae]|uniref:Patatin-like phospholipase n=1 Tax=Kribbella steppae TaxID=2512223 RepID=A0A4R2HMD5_9ACTN|nr:hypothetical protein [Kribbella steppae]TCO32403.1 hypothetical protein EV652_1049 [Kribbella steppae]
METEPIADADTPAGPALNYWFATPVILLLIGAICMSEIDRLVTGALTDAGQSRSVTDVVGLALFGGRDTWDVWVQVDDPTPVAGWIALHAIFDIALYVGYGWLLWKFVRTCSQARKALKVLLTLEVIETVGLLIAAGLLATGRVSDVWAFILSGVATFKWIAAGILVLAILVDDGRRHALRDGGMRVLRALKKQRLSFLVVALFGILSIVPLPNIWDQLPDVQRSWLDGDRQGQWHAIWAAAATMVVSIYLFVLGRLRAERVWNEQVGSTAPPPGAPPDRHWRWRWWLAAAIAPWIVAVILGVLKIDVGWGSVVVASAFPLGVLALSVVPRAVKRWWDRRLERSPVLARWRSRVVALWRSIVAAWRRFIRMLRRLLRSPAVPAVAPPPDEPPPSREENIRFARDVWRAGDLLAASLWVLAGLGLVRSLVAPVMLGPRGQGQTFVEVVFGLPIGTVWSVRLIVLIGGVVFAVVVMPLIVLATRALRPPEPAGANASGLRHFLDPRTPTPPQGRAIAVGVGLIVASVAWILALMLLPATMTRHAGVVATTLLTLGAWAFILGIMIVRLQRSDPPPIFRSVGMGATPLLTLLIALTLVASASGGDPQLHAIRASQDAGAQQLDALPRGNLDGEFKKWLERSAGCEQDIDGTKVRPMVLVAASGGGVRAAVWTAAVLDTFRTAKCARTAVFLSSGVSGGSVGLALSRGDDIEKAKIGYAEKLAEPNALAAAMAGLLAGDLVGGGTGLRIPSYSNGDFAWRDRAGLIETYWESEVGSLKEQFDTKVSGPGGVLVFNSAVAGRGCRVLISQVELTTGLASRPVGTDADRANCSGQTAQPAASLDLQDAYGPCVEGMSWATAAMLSARFPTVTPGGRISCEPVDETRPDLQLIDGGYAEAAGLGTLSDIAPMLVQVVRNYNASSPDSPPVVPVVLFLEDAARGDIVEPPQGLSTELLVPLAGRNAKAVQTTSGTLLQRVATGIADPCPISSPTCQQAVRALHREVPHGIVIAAPLTRPSVEAPLGWTLSADSITRLKTAVADEAGRKCEPSKQAGNGSDDAVPLIRPGAYVCLNQLLATLD